MPVDCPICAEKIPDPETFCAACGFPVALQPSAVALDEAEPAGPPKSAAVIRSTPPRHGASTTPRGRDQTAEACQKSAEHLMVHLKILAQLGGSPQSFVGEMRQAALVQAEGRPAESLELLKSAESRADREVDELFERRAQDLEARSEALARQGVPPELPTSITRRPSPMPPEERTEAATAIVETDRRLASIEQDLRGIQGLLAQIDALRSGVLAAGETPQEVDRDVAQIRELLARPRVDASVLDTAAQVAARALMLLSESLPPMLEAALDRAGTTLSAYPPEHEGARAAKSIHAEASRHLRRGRLPEASGRLIELQRLIGELEEAPVAPARAAVVAEAATGEAEVVAEDPLPKLLTKARSLATRVRALAPESELAFEAAAEIRRATELLRARKLDEADGALTRLMRTLDSETVSGA